MGLFDTGKSLVDKAVGKIKQLSGGGGGGGGGAVDYFLKIEDVEGESEDDKHKGEIEIMSFELAAAQIGTGGSGTGSGAGKVQFDEMTIAALTNKASPVLLLACSTGKHFPKAVLTARKAGGEQQDYLTITLTDVLITGYQQQDQGEADPRPIDVFRINFAEIDIDYKPQNTDGSLGGAIKAGFNLKKNVKK